MRILSLNRFLQSCNVAACYIFRCRTRAFIVTFSTLLLVTLTGCSTIQTRADKGARPFAGTRDIFGSHDDDPDYDPGVFALFDIPGSFALDVILLPYDLCFDSDSNSTNSQ